MSWTNYRRYGSFWYIKILYLSLLTMTETYAHGHIVCWCTRYRNAYNDILLNVLIFSLISITDFHQWIVCVAILKWHNLNTDNYMLLRRMGTIWLNWEEVFYRLVMNSELSPGYYFKQFFKSPISTCTNKTWFSSAFASIFFISYLPCILQTKGRYFLSFLSFFCANHVKSFDLVIFMEAIYPISQEHNIMV